MPNISRGGVDLTDVAICPECPGEAKIYPASALANHMARSHSGHDPASRICENCGERFAHTVNSNPDFTYIARCAKCRRAKKVKRGPKKKAEKNHSRGHAQEFIEGIKSR